MSDTHYSNFEKFAEDLITYFKSKLPELDEATIMEMAEYITFKSVNVTSMALIERDREWKRTMERGRSRSGHFQYQPMNKKGEEPEPETSYIEDSDTEPRKPIYQSYNSHDSETFYKCPWCNKTFGDWSLFNQTDRPDVTKPYCPWCHKPLKEVK